jgi:GNAT superfamily N-acetyltransferase
MCDNSIGERPQGLRIKFRSTDTSDAAFIVEMARHACVIEDWPLPDPDSGETKSLLPASDDMAIVAIETAGVRLGAVWTFFHHPPLLLGTNGVALPEIAIAVNPEMRGQGIGGALLDELATRCIGTFEALSLNVHQRNPVIHLYERKGFQMQGRGRGALGIAMTKYLR